MPECVAIMLIKVAIVGVVRDDFAVGVGEFNGELAGS
jgi:hypothetical protein